MAFESVRITTLRNGVGAVIGAREDLAQGDVMTLALTDSTGVSSYRWEIVGRPEYSVAGGVGGPNPWLLGTGATASFTVDSDSGSVHLDGTYIVRCVVNIDTPTETRISTELARKTALTIPALPSGTRSLRKLGMFESLEDMVSIANVLGGWSTMINRWLEYLTGVGGGGGGFPGYGVVGNISQIDVGDTAVAGALATVARADHQHALPVPTVITDVAAASALGTSTKVAREDHTHKGVHSVNGLFGDVTTDTFPGYASAGSLSQIDVGDMASAGVLLTVPRADHQHPLPVPTVITAVAAVSALGASAKVAREDHAHQGVHSVNGLFGDVVLANTFPGYGVVGDLTTIDVGDAASAGTLATVSRSDHQHALPVPTVITDVAAASALGTSTKVAREDHTHKGVHSVNGLFGDVTVSSGDPFPGYGAAGSLSQIDIGDAAAAGSLTTVARADHQHTMPAPTVINDVLSASALGTSTKAAREDHAHKGVHSVNGLFGDVTIASSFPGYGVAGDLSQIDVGDSAAAGGLAVVARADHQHPLPVPTVITAVAAVSALGTSAKVAREDHAHQGVHSVNGLFGDVTIAVSSFPGYGVVGNISQIDIGDAASAGALATVARADHQHALPAPSSVTEIAAAGAIGSSSIPARQDHVHKGVHSVNGQFGDVVINTGSASSDGFWFIDQDAVYDTSASDANAGFVVAAMGSTFTPHGIALRTWEEFFIRCPKQGAGHKAVILVAPRAGGAAYRNKANTEDEYMDFAGFSGYKLMLRRGSNLSNDADDKAKCGAMNGLTGPNGDGYFLTSASTTTAINVASSLGATDSAVKYRGRFASDTPTVALRNVCFFISANTGTVITPGVPLTTTPPAGEKIYIERPGVRVGKFADVDASAGLTEPGFIAYNVQTVGFGFTTLGQLNGGGEVSVGVNGFSCLYSFCETVNASSNVVVFTKESNCLLRFDSLWIDETNGSSHEQGLSFCSRSFFQLFAGAQSVNLEAFVSENATVSIKAGSGSIIGAKGSRFTNGSFTAFFPSVGAGGSNVVGTLSGQSPAQFRGVGVQLGGWASIINIDVSGSPAAAIRIPGSATFSGKRTHKSKLYFDKVTGSGNAGYGVDLSGCDSADCILESSTVTVTGALGDIHMSPDVVVKYSDLLDGNVIDNHGNSIRGDGGAVCGQALLVLNSEGSTIPAGTAICFDAEADDDQAEVVIADLSDPNRARIDGYMVTTMGVGKSGYAVPAGAGAPALKSGGGFTGAPCYLSTTPGQLSLTPTTVFAGIFVRAGSSSGKFLLYSGARPDPDTFPYLTDSAGSGVTLGQVVRLFSSGLAVIKPTIGIVSGTPPRANCEGWAGVTLADAGPNAWVLVKRAGLCDVLVFAADPGAIGASLWVSRSTAGVATTFLPSVEDAGDHSFPVGFVAGDSVRVPPAGRSYVQAMIIPCAFDNPARFSDGR